MKRLTFERLFWLADNKKSVYWTSHKRRWPAAFFQNWNARQLQRWMDEGWITEESPCVTPVGNT